MVTSSRSTVGSQTRAALDRGIVSGSAGSGESTVRGASEARSTDSTVLSHPGIPSFSSRAKPIPRVWPAAASLRHAPYSADNLRAKQFVLHAVLAVASSFAASTIIEVFFPPAADTEAAAAGYSADAPRRQSAAQKRRQFLALEHPSGLLYLPGPGPPAFRR